MTEWLFWGVSIMLATAGWVIEFYVEESKFTRATAHWCYVVAIITALFATAS